MGAFLTFIDADDWVEPDYLENLLAGKGCDLSVCNYKIDGSDIVWNSNINNGIQNKDGIRYLFISGQYSGYSFIGTNCKLFKSAIITRENLRFNENISSDEDSLFVLEYFVTSTIITERTKNYITIGSRVVDCHRGKTL